MTSDGRSVIRTLANLYSIDTGRALEVALASESLSVRMREHLFAEAWRWSREFVSLGFDVSHDADLLSIWRDAGAIEFARLFVDARELARRTGVREEIGFEIERFTYATSGRRDVIENGAASILRPLASEPGSPPRGFLDFVRAEFLTETGVTA